MNSNNKRILIVDFTNFYGGGQKFIKNLQILLSEELIFSFAISNQKLIDQLENQEILRLKSSLFYVFYEIHKINTFIKKNNIKYVILNGNRPIYFSFLLTKKVKKIAYRHTSCNAYNNIFKKIFIISILNFNYLFCYRIVILYKKAINEIFLSKTRVRVIANPIILKNKMEYPKIIFNKDIITLLVITRIDPDKGLEWLIDCFSKLNTITKQKIQLKIAGIGPFKNQIENQIKKLNLKNVHLLGFVDDVSILLKNSDIFLLTSKFESFPLSIIEALSYGLPIISTNSGGIEELVQDNINGYLIDYKYDKQLINAMCTLIDDNKKRIQFGNVSSNLYLQKYTVDDFKINFLKYLIY